MLNLRRFFKNYTDSARSISELLPWMLQVDGDIVLNKDGSTLVVYRYQGVDQEGLTTMEVDTQAKAMEHAYRNFNERITVWWTVDRRRTQEYPQGKFASKVGRLIDEAWKNHFVSGKQYSNTYHLAILYSPSRGTDAFFDKVSYFTREAGMSLGRAVFEAVKAQFSKQNSFALDQSQIDYSIREMRAILDSFEDAATTLGLVRLKDEGLLSYLHDRSSPGHAGMKVRAAKIPMYLDGWLASNTITVERDLLKFSGSRDYYAGAMSIKDWPEISRPGLLDEVLSVQGELTLSQCFRFAEYSEARSYIEKTERHNLAMQKSIFSYIKEAITKEESTNIDRDRVAKAEDAGSALLNLTSQNRAFGWYNMTVLAYGETRREAEENIRNVGKLFQHMSFMPVRETMHLLSAWAGTLPAQWTELVRWFFVHSGNLADLSPIRTMSSGENKNHHLSEQSGKYQPALTVLPTEYSTPFYFNFHMTDVAHTLVVGPSGAGKSVLDNFLISQFLKYSPCNVFIFDKDYSCRIPTVLQGGDHIDLLGERGREVKLNPFTLIEDKENWPWLKSWLEILLTSRGYTLTAEDDDDIKKAFENMLETGRKHWRLSTMQTFLRGELGLQLTDWIGEGAKAKYFDNEDDSFSLNTFTCVEMGGLFLSPKLASAFMEYAFFRIQQQLDGKPTLIYIEEAWFMLEDERFSAKINDWLKTLRKKNAFVLMATQSLDEIAKSSIFATIIDNIPNRIFLANPNAMAHRDMYMKKFNLNEMQVDRIRTALPKQHYYITTPYLSRMVDLSLPRVILDCLRSDARAQRVMDKASQAGRNLAEAYMEEIL